MTARRLVIGIGNPDRGDDGAGHEVIRLLTGRAPPGVKLLRHTGEATTLMGCLQRADAAYLIDASASGAAPGTVRRFDVVAGALPSGLAVVSSHGLGLAQAIEMARILGALPRRCLVYAIEGHRFSVGASLTAAVVRATAVVADQIVGELTSPAVSDADDAAACGRHD